ncbi:glycosyltransferase family 4 protein [Lutimonas vermicola]|uniref:Glycosyltransferase family 4 protein n=1 Tax=Lutimonas vermicola TaxID=414288 RepID=A0ABU9L401_9FLAO
MSKFSKNINVKHKVLITTNPLDHEGGMVEFNKGLINAINKKENNINLEPFSIGSRMYLFYYPTLKKLLYIFFYLFDLFRLITKLSNYKVKVIQVNPSLIPVPLFRDGIVLIINRFFFKKKSIIVLHGWKEHVYKSIINNKLLKYSIKKYFNSVDIIYVLSGEFKNKLINIGILESKIKTTTTFFYKENISKESNPGSNVKLVKLLFLGRVSKLKGIEELIEALKIIAENHNDFLCNIIGHGDKPNTIENYKNVVDSYNLSDKIKFLGRITGKEKFEAFSNSDIYIFPSYMEGCPTSVIEALATGLFVISSDVGALNDIIDSSNGIKTKPKNIKELVFALEKGLKNINQIRIQRKDISKDAFQKYEVSFIADDFLQSYKAIL